MCYLRIASVYVQILECLFRNRWNAEDGLGALIISPTRELAYQTFEVLCKVGKKHDFSAGLIIGGKVIIDCLELYSTCQLKFSVKKPGEKMRQGTFEYYMSVVHGHFLTNVTLPSRYRHRMGNPSYQNHSAGPKQGVNVIPTFPYGNFSIRRSL